MHFLDIDSDPNGLKRSAANTAAVESLLLPTLAGPRVLLRWMSTRDIPDLFDLYSDEKLLAYSPRRRFENADDAAIYLEAAHRGFEQGSRFEWGIAKMGSDALIGTIALKHIDREQNRASVRLSVNSAQWGNAYGREALGLAVKYAFKRLGLRRLEADADPRNSSALKALEKNGFKREGYLRQRWSIRGELQDSIVLGLLSSDWQS